MAPLEQRIAYKFGNSLLLAEALTHPSLAYETNRPHFDNQRLEFLGDAVLQLILTEKLFTMFPGFSEGRLTKLRSRLVSRDALCRYAASIDLGDYLLLGKGEAASGGNARPSNLADGFEALLGAIYLDSGFESARDVVIQLCREGLEHVAEEPEEINPKGQLQEILQSISSVGPSYRIIDQEGPDHQKTFTACVLWENRELGFGHGHSKKEAEIEAALNAIADRRWENNDESAVNETGEQPANVSVNP
ncbi:MAG: ribonuclease III [Verrucomicrobiales bacterium]